MHEHVHNLLILLHQTTAWEQKEITTPTARELNRSLLITSETLQSRPETQLLRIFSFSDSEDDIFKRGCHVFF